MQWRRVVLFFIALFVLAYALYALTRPLPDPTISANINFDDIKEKPLESKLLGFGWGAVGYIDPNNKQIVCRNIGNDPTALSTRPTASLAKMITSLVVLEKYPLKNNGPAITMTPDDEARYWLTLNSGGSNVPVYSGQTLSQKQLIEGIMLASANNMADSLAIWAFGSLDNYRLAAQDWLKRHNLNSTSIGNDASGFNASTTSNAIDLCKIALTMRLSPELMKIIGQKEIDYPVIGKLKNTNRLLGQNGVVGGKTGYTDEAGRGVAILSDININNENIAAATVSLNNNSYSSAFDSSGQLIDKLKKDISVINVKSGSTFGSIHSYWGKNSELINNKGLKLVRFSDQPINVKTTKYLSSPESVGQNSLICEINVNGNNFNLINKNKIARPSWLWRLTNPI